MKFIRLWKRLFGKSIRFDRLPCKGDLLDDRIFNDFDLQIKRIVRILTYEIGDLKYFVYKDAFDRGNYMSVHVSPTGMYHLEMFYYSEDEQKLVNEIKEHRFCPSWLRLFHCISPWEYRHYRNNMDEFYRRLRLQYMNLF